VEVQRRKPALGKEGPQGILKVWSSATLPLRERATRRKEGRKKERKKQKRMQKEKKEKKKRYTLPVAVFLQSSSTSS